MNEQWLVDAERYKNAHRVWQASSGNEGLATYLGWAGMLLFVGGAFFGAGADDGQRPVAVATVGLIVGIGGFVWRTSLRSASERSWREMDCIRLRFQFRGYHVKDNGELSPH